jgi:toxin FitB
MRALLDTSFFVAEESGRPLGDMADVTETEISVITVAELTLGVLVSEEDSRANRVATLSAVESQWDPLPITAEVAREFAQIVADLRNRLQRVPILDALLAATAIVEEIPIVSRHGAYSPILGVQVIRV